MKTYLKYNGLVSDLKSDALRDRHWRQLRQALKADWNFADLTLGKIWDSDLQKHEEVFKNIINTAQGELALEEFLKTVREFWQSYELDLVTYQKSKTRLIRFVLWVGREFVVVLLLFFFPFPSFMFSHTVLSFSVVGMTCLPNFPTT